MNELELHNYNLEATLLGGQSFSWDKIEDTYYGFTRDRLIKIQLNENKLIWQTYPTQNDEVFIKEYFRLNDDYEAIIKAIKSDEHVAKGITAYPNLRLLKQDFEETLLSFIISANNNIKSIKRSVRLLSQKFGKKIELDGHTFYLFPETQALAQATLEDLLSCSLGFRAKYIKAAANHLIQTNLSEKIHSLDPIQALTELKKIKGVGDKIADCVMVFALAHDHITPMDVWAKRALDRYYGLGQKMKYDEMRKWATNQFGQNASWAGQFLFEYIRQNEKSQH